MNGLYFRKFVFVCVLAHLVFNAASYQQYNGCIFGNDCYFDCKCESGDCDRITGECSSNRTCVKEDSLMTKYYPPEYSAGAGCQMGNLAYKMNAMFNTHALSEAMKVPATSGDIDHHYSSLTFDSFPEAFVVQFAEMANVAFVEILLHPTVDLRHFTENFNVSLDMEVKEFTSNAVGCTVEAAPPFALINRLPRNITRIHYKCDMPSTGKVLKVTTYKPLKFPYHLPMSRIVTVGHRYIDIDRVACKEPAGDELVGWCNICEGSYPPDCRRKCTTHQWGDNCTDTCPSDCPMKKCDSMNGQCITDLVEMTKKPPGGKGDVPVASKNGHVVQLVIGMLVLVAVVGVVGGYIYWNRRKWKANPGHQLLPTGQIDRQDSTVCYDPKTASRYSTGVSVYK